MVDGGLICWFILGNVLYYSKVNDCESKPQTFFISKFMQCILIVGYFAIPIYIVILFAIPYLNWLKQFEKQRATEESKRLLMELLQSLTRVKFNRSILNHDAQCAICLQEYSNNEQVIKLECDTRHYFHSKCLESSILKGTLKCPLCR